MTEAFPGLSRRSLLAAGLCLWWAGAAAAQPATPVAALEETAIAGFPYAKLYRQPGAVRRPVVVVLHGAEGGDEAGRSFGPILARLGYATVSMPYYSPNWGQYGPPPTHPELPGSMIDIRIDRLAELRDVLRRMPGLDTGRFALFAGSKGSEFALIAASRYGWIDAVVAYTPSDLVWEGWGLEAADAPGTLSSFSFKGKPLPFMPYRDFYADTSPLAALRPPHENGRADHPEKEAVARIPIERFKGALIVIAGDEDRMWNAGRMARNIAATRTRAGRATEVLIYPQAGHDLIGGSAGLREDPRGGGTASANAQARTDAWPKVLAFLAKTLKPLGGVDT